MALVNERTTIREREASPQCPRGGPRASHALRSLLESRVECDDPARVVVLSDQREPRDPSVPSNYASLLLDNGCRAEFDLTHSKQRIGVTSTRQFRKADRKSTRLNSSHLGISY